MVSDKDLEHLLTLDPDKDITKTYFIEMMGRTKKGPPKYKRNEPLVIPKGKYHNNTQPINTTLGKLIYNRFCLEDFYDILGYINKPVDKDVFGDIENSLAAALLEDKITTEQYAKFIDKNSFFYGLVIILSPSFTKATIVPNKQVLTRRQELIKKYKKEIEAGDAITGSRMEKELLDLAKHEVLEKDPCGELFLSKASKLTFNNTYKNMKVMRGPIVDTSSGEFKVSTSNYTEGIKPEEIPLYANIAVAGAYARGKGTQVGGYNTKQFVAAYQTQVLGEPGSDCGTTKTTLVKVNKKKHRYRYIVDKGKLILLDSENLKKYDGQIVHMRTPMYCKDKQICNKCAGELYYKLGIKNIGLTLARLSNSVMNACLKKSHDVTVKVYRINIEDLVLDTNIK